ncbi:hypothetical protein CANCADRAFT_99951 [Tortispora caseinolytica NRRL Y-17796]|uniref:Fe2OG dioxygenase domain-containing protein n=1 Tax=Tortispora caseinolytica NRRL Y-17796 TaxID=767744 RepID=A0A1E4TE60_9ASCO|nr:hypothetical protein CANCADRAFT_99951 [Tortispora caseinolytica NRRL Y-17796]
MSSPVTIVNISEINQDTAEKLLKAAHTQGFIYLSGTGLTQLDVNKAFDASRALFSLPDEEKSRYKITPANRGYSKMFMENLDPDVSKTGDPKEAWNIGAITKQEDGSYTAEQDMPKAAEQYYADISTFQQKCYDLMRKILLLLGMSLKIDKEAGGDNYFVERHDPNKLSGSILRMLHYPGISEDDLGKPERGIRAGAHTDYGSVTLLFQRPGDVPGLEIYSPISKKWELVPVEDAPGGLNDDCAPVLVNIADQLSYWTAGLLRSTIHRVRFPVDKTCGERYSIAFFGHPDHDTLLSPIPSELVQKREGRGANAKGEKILTAGEHLRKRLDATYSY